MNLRHKLILASNFNFEVIEVINKYLKSTLVSTEEKFSEIENNFELIISKLRNINFVDFLTILNNNEYLNELLYTKYKDIKDAIISVDSYAAVISYYSMIEESLDQEQDFINFLEPFFEYFFNDILKIFININAFNISENKVESLKKRMNFYYIMNSEKVVTSLIENNLRRNVKFFYAAADYDLQDIDLYFVTKVLNELLEQNNMGYCDIEFIESGSFSTVLIIGNNVLKVGEPRKTFYMYNSEHILQPFFRYQFSDEKGREYLTVELTQKAIIGKIRKEELYDLYKAIREDGMIWGDCKAENVGCRVRCNLPNYNGLYINNINQRINGLLDNPDSKPNTSGFYVVDIDYLFNENDQDPSLLFLSKEFEKRYSVEESKERKHTK